MSRLLYIEANPNIIQDSFGKKVGEEFLRNYKDNNPNDFIKKLDLYGADKPPLIDADILEVMKASGRGEEITSSKGSDGFKKIIGIVDDFLSFSKIVIVSPMWNFSVPPYLKAYIDSFVIANKTFRYTENGPIALLKGEGKKFLHIHSSGGVYSKGPGLKLDHSASYLRDVFNFIGIEDQQIIRIEATALPEANENFEIALEQSRVVSREF